MHTVQELYKTEQPSLKDRKMAAAAHPELVLYLMTTSRIDRTGSISGREPLGHLILGSYLHMVGWDVRVFAGSTYDALDLLIVSRDSDRGRSVLVGLYCDYENMEAVTKLASRIKKQLGYPVLLGGPQAIALDESFVRRNPCVDAFIRGDGEHSLSDVLTAYASGHPEERFLIRGVCGLLDGRYIDNGYSDPLTDMDESPSVTDAIMVRRGPRRFLAALSGRGCPFHCSFCYEGGNSKTVRLRSVGHMMQELEERLAAHPEAKYIYFGDDTFTLRPDRVAAFCAALKELRKRYDFVWFADGHVRVLLAHPEYLPMMIDAGLRRMQIGIESTCQPIIDIYNKNVRKEEFFKVLDLCMEAGLPQLTGNIIIGGALETEESIRETFDTVYELLRRSRGILDVTSTLYSHFPGTAISRDPGRFGLEVLDPDGLTSFGDYPIARTSDLGLDRIASLRREFIYTSQQVMRECVRKGEVDEWRILQTFDLHRRYGLSNMWFSFGMTNNLKRYYTCRSAWGTDFEDLRQVDAAIPMRTALLSGERDYPSPVPRVDGYPLSPFEEELFRLCAGKLSIGEICGRLMESRGEAFADRQELEHFTMERLLDLNKRRMLVFLELSGQQPAGKTTGENEQKPHGGCSTAEEGKQQVREEAEPGKSVDGRNKVLLFYPYTVAGAWDKNLTGSTQGVFILGAVLKQAGYDAKVCECVFNQIPGYIRREDPETVLAVGMSLDYENRRLVLKLSRMIREEMGIPVILGGVDARTVTGEELLFSKACAVIKGEGELTLPKVVTALKSSGNMEDISGLLLMRHGKPESEQSVVWRKEEEGETWWMEDTGPEEPPLDLDAVPFADYSLSLVPLTSGKFRILTSRGCPNHCAFCHEGTHKTRLRKRSIPNVLREIHELIDLYPQLTHLAFCDDTLVTDETRVRELCEGLNQIRKTRDLQWYCEADIWSLDRHPDLLPIMIEAGLTYLQVGIESGDDELLSVYEKRLTTDMVRRVVAHAYEAGLAGMFGPILVGAPFENRAHIEKEKAWIRELTEMAPGMLQMLSSIIVPYPQTRIGREPQRYGYTFTDREGDTSNSDYPAYYTAEMTEKEILGAYQELTDTYLHTVKRLIEEGKVPFEQLRRIVEIHQVYGNDITWGVALQGLFPIIYSYFQLLLRCRVEPLRTLPEEEIPDWHIQRTFEIWRFVNVTGAAPTLEGYVLSPYEYQIILYAAGKLTIREIAERMYPSFNGGDSRELFLRRVIDTILFFESRYWLVGMPY